MLFLIFVNQKLAQDGFHEVFLYEDSLEVLSKEVSLALLIKYLLSRHSAVDVSELNYQSCQQVKDYALKEAWGFSFFVEGGEGADKFLINVDCVLEVVLNVKEECTGKHLCEPAANGPSVGNLNDCARQGGLLFVLKMFWEKC